MRQCLHEIFRATFDSLLITNQIIFHAFKGSLEHKELRILCIPVLDLFISEMCHFYQSD